MITSMHNSYEAELLNCLYHTFIQRLINNELNLKHIGYLLLTDEQFQKKFQKLEDIQQHIEYLIVNAYYKKALYWILYLNKYIDSLLKLCELNDILN